MHHERPLPGYTVLEERSDMLDRLNEIPLKGFPEMEETPTSATMSLPTPHCDRVPLPLDGGMEVPPNMPVSYLFPSDDTGIVVPNAPRMKDYDTFTEGTGGSFDFLPAADTNEFGEPIYPINTCTLAALPLHDAVSSIEQWRQDVDDHLVPQGPAAETAPLAIPRTRTAAPELPTIPIIDLTSDSEAGTTPTNTKRPRPRSNDAEDDDARRNRRARASSPPSPNPRRARAQSFSSASSGILNSFLWVDRGPPPNARPRARAPSRANSAPPD
ncbi:hypothetical protein B0H17DRAFT_231636 [Mycena rosella]|uniref:Uncharacterized protein n=1 Tax=Mycena rosella TaxID=1033263 RepID=A0AAD7H184_MYCRO|nr:hypothetical protein B0H17DRAFT_231636 [Mycena rosella]